MMNLARLRVPVAAAAAAAMLLFAAGAVTLLMSGPNRVAATQAGTPSAVAPAATRPGAGVAAAATATAPAEAETSPKAVVLAAFRAAAAGDADALISRFDRVTPAQADTLKQVAQLMGAADRLTDAVRQVFGAEMELEFSRALSTGVSETDLTSAVETIEGDTAVVDVGAGPGKIPLVRAGRTWKISAEVLRTLNPNALRQFAPRVGVIDQLTADIAAGKYKTVDELRQAVAALSRASRQRPTTATTTATRRPLGDSTAR